MANGEGPLQPATPEEVSRREVHHIAVVVENIEQKLDEINIPRTPFIPASASDILCRQVGRILEVVDNIEKKLDKANKKIDAIMKKHKDSD